MEELRRTPLFPKIWPPHSAKVNEIKSHYETEIRQGNARTEDLNDLIKILPALAVPLNPGACTHLSVEKSNFNKLLGLDKVRFSCLPHNVSFKIQESTFGFAADKKENYNHKKNVDEMLILHVIL